MAAMEEKNMLEVTVAMDEKSPSKTPLEHDIFSSPAQQEC
jgi:hypothetical protein